MNPSCRHKTIFNHKHTHRFLTFKFFIFPNLWWFLCTFQILKNEIRNAMPPPPPVWNFTLRMNNWIYLEKKVRGERENGLALLIAVSRSTVLSWHRRSTATNTYCVKEKVSKQSNCRGKKGKKPEPRSETLIYSSKILACFFPSCVA